MLSPRLRRRELPKPTLEITEGEKKSFSDIAKAMIFNSEFNLELNQENLPQIVEQLISDFLQIKDEAQKKIADFANSAFANMNEIISTPIFPQVVTVETTTSDAVLAEVREVVLEPKNFFNEVTVADVEVYTEYSHWAFTPKLSKEFSENGDKTFSFNCVGRAISKAIDLEKEGGDVVMLLAAEHPEVAVLVDGKLVSKEKEVEGRKVTQGDIFLYKADKISHLYQQLYVVVKFREAVLYEVLENLEALRQIILGNKDVELFGYMKKVEPVVEKYGALLTATNWKILQKKLFPKLAQFFTDHKKEIEQEFKNVKKIRLEKTAREELGKILSAYRQELYRDMESDQYMKSQLDVLERAKKYGLQIFYFLTFGKWGGKEFYENDGDVKIFFEFIFNKFSELKDYTEEESITLIGHIIGAMTAKLLSKEDIEKMKIDTGIEK